MEGIQGQLQFKLNHDMVIKSNGEHCLSNVDYLDSMVDGNQNRFVFIRSKEGSIYYFVEEDKQRIEYKVLDTGLVGSLFRVVKDEVGRLVVFCISKTSIYVIRQQVFHPTLFDCPTLFYQAMDELIYLDTLVWYDRVVLGVVVRKLRGYGIIIGELDDFMQQEVMEEEVPGTYFEWNTQNDGLAITVFGGNRVETIVLHRLRRTPVLIASDIKPSAVCSSVMGQEKQQLLAQENDYDEVVQAVSQYYCSVQHWLVLDKQGHVYHQVNRLDGIKKELIADLSHVKGVYFMKDGSTLRAIAIDKEHDILYSLVYALPTESWRVLPLVLYYERKYRILIHQDVPEIHVPQLRYEGFDPHLLIPSLYPAHEYCYAVS